MDLRGIGTHRPHRFFAGQRRGDVLREGVSHHLQDVARELGHVHDDRRPAVAAAREHEQLAHHVCSALRRSVEGHQVLQLLGIGLPFLQEGDRDQDRREHVVQVVRDASDEGADALDPLGAQQMLFESFALGDVGVDGQDSVRLSAIAAEQGPAALDQHSLVVAGHLAELPRPGAIAQGGGGRARVAFGV